MAIIRKDHPVMLVNTMGVATHPKRGLTHNTIVRTDVVPETIAMLVQAWFKPMDKDRDCDLANAVFVTAGWKPDIEFTVFGTTCKLTMRGRVVLCFQITCQIAVLLPDRCSEYQEVRKGDALFINLPENQTMVLMLKRTKRLKFTVLYSEPSEVNIETNGVT